MGRQIVRSNVRVLNFASASETAVLELHCSDQNLLQRYTTNTTGILSLKLFSANSAHRIDKMGSLWKKTLGKAEWLTA
jgi:hypothetical protein